MAIPSTDYVTRAPVGFVDFVASLEAHTDWRVDATGTDTVTITDGQNYACAQKYGDRVVVSPYGLSRVDDLVRRFDMAPLREGGRA